ncbi:MAG: hypothetical protein IH919_10120 [Deltaproteobacteria bacterium]|nr:hypothetical protein [Deltaproteobacteria bacterium]
MPIDHVRWAKTSGSKWGHGPGHISLPTVLTLQEMVKHELAYVEKVIEGGRHVEFQVLADTQGAVVHLFDTSMTGVLVYAPNVDPPGPDALVWVDQEGNEDSDEGISCNQPGGV